MTPKGKKQEPPFGLRMEFDEALICFARTDPKEVEENIKRSKQKKPRRKKRKKTAGGKKSPPATLGDTVISLRDRRMRKRNYGR